MGMRGLLEEGVDALVEEEALQWLQSRVSDDVLRACLRKRRSYFPY